MKIEQVDWRWDHPVVQDLVLRYYRDFLFSDQRKADATIARVIELSGKTPPGSILDIGCGLGYHAIAFSQNGFSVFSFDIGDRYLALAREHAEQAKTVIEFSRMSLTELNGQRQFVLAWAGAYCPGKFSQEEHEQCLRKIFTALIPGGCFISTVAGKPYQTASSKVRNWALKDDCFVFSEKWSDDALAHEECYFTWPQTGKTIKIYEVERMYGVEQMVALLANVGFERIEVWKDINSLEAVSRKEDYAFRCYRPNHN